MKEFLERVFEAKMERTKELVQGRCADCMNKRGHRPSTSEPRVAKLVISQHYVCKCNVKGFGIGTNILVFRYYKKHHSGKCQKKSRACIKCGLTEHWIRECPCIR